MRKQVRIKLGLNSAPVKEGSLALSEDGTGEIVGKRQPVGGALLHMLMARSEGKAVVPGKKPRRGRPPKAKAVEA